MPPELSRRALLASVGTLGMASLAGCGGFSRRSLESLPAPPSKPLQDLQVHKIRIEEPVRLFGTVEEDAEGPNPNYEFVDSAAELDSLDWNEQVAAAADLREFLAETDFEARTAMAFQTTVSACREYHLVQIRYSDGDIDSEFCRGLRPADVACSEGTEHTVGFGIRLPLTDLDLSTVGWGTGRCEDTVGHYLDTRLETAGGDG